MRRVVFLLSILALLSSCSSKQSEQEITSNKKNSGADAVPVKVQEMKYQKFSSYFEVNGIIEAENQAFVSPEINGQIKSILVEEGQRVLKGQLLVKLNTEVTQKSIEELKTRLDLAQIAFNKQKSLWDQKIGSEMQYLQSKNNLESLEKSLETLDAQMEMASIRAPFSGIVDEIFQKEGEIASPGRQVIQLVNLSNIIINADVSESYISKISKGDSVLVSFPSYPDIELKVPVFRTGNIINPSNRTFTVQLKMRNIEEKLKPNLMAVLKIKDFAADSVFVIPSLIVKQDLSKGKFIFKVVENNGVKEASKTYVKTGISSNNRTVIKEGLKEGDEIIVEGYNMVSTGIPVDIR
mgnify:CR=1 FL=1